MSAPGELLVSEYLSDKVKKELNLSLDIFPGKLVDCWTKEEIGQYLKKKLKFEAEDENGNRYAVEAVLTVNPEITVEDVVKGNYYDPAELFDFKDIEVRPLAKRIGNIEIDLELTDVQIEKLEKQIAKAAPEGHEVTNWGYRIVGWIETAPVIKKKEEDWGEPVRTVKMY